MEPNEKRVFKAHLRRMRISPYKVRKVADMIRGMPCDKALSVLEYTHNRGAYFLSNLLKSAMANVSSYNLDHNTDYDVERMFISELRVDEGPRIKRWRAAPMGRAVPILKRTCHISIALREMPVEEPEQPEEPEVKAEEKKPKPKRRRAKKAAEAKAAAEAPAAKEETKQEAPAATEAEAAAPDEGGQENEE